MRKFILMFYLVLFAVTFAEEVSEKSLWDKFVGFFTPKSTPEGSGVLYEQLKEIDDEISREQLAYNRERRPQKKSRIKLNLEALQEKRERLVQEIEKQEKTSLMSSYQVEVSSSSKENPTAVIPGGVQGKQPEIALIFRDTIYIRDTVWLDCENQDLKAKDSTLVEVEEILRPE